MLERDQFACGVLSLPNPGSLQVGPRLPSGTREGEKVNGLRNPLSHLFTEVEIGVQR